MFNGNSIVDCSDASASHSQNEIANAAIAEMTGLISISQPRGCHSPTCALESPFGDGWDCSPYETNKVWVHVSSSEAADMGTAAIIARKKVDADRSYLKIIHICDDSRALV